MTVAALAIGAASAVLAAPPTDTAGRHVLHHFFGLSRDSICGWIILLGLLGGAFGLVLLVLGLIERINKTWVRETTLWAAVGAAVLASPIVALPALLVFLMAVGNGDQTRFEADDGQSVVVTQDGFDGDIVGIYTQCSRFHYIWNRPAQQLNGFPRVKDQDCELNSSAGKLLLTFGTETVTINP